MQNAPTVRSGHSAVLVPELGEAGSLYVFGGQDYTTGQLLNDLHCLDLASLTWRLVDAKGTAPAPRTSHSCAHLAGKLAVFGGSNEGELKDDLVLFDLASETWSSPGSGRKRPESSPCAVQAR